MKKNRVIFFVVIGPILLLFTLTIMYLDFMENHWTTYAFYISHLIAAVFYTTYGVISWLKLKRLEN